MCHISPWGCPSRTDLRTVPSRKSAAPSAAPRAGKHRRAEFAVPVRKIKGERVLAVRPLFHRNGSKGPQASRDGTTQSLTASAAAAAQRQTQRGPAGEISGGASGRGKRRRPRHLVHRCRGACSVQPLDGTTNPRTGLGSGSRDAGCCARFHAATSSAYRGLIDSLAMRHLRRQVTGGCGVGMGRMVHSGARWHFAATDTSVSSVGGAHRSGGATGSGGAARIRSLCLLCSFPGRSGNPPGRRSVALVPGMSGPCVGGGDPGRVLSRRGVPVPRSTGTGRAGLLFVA